MPEETKFSARRVRYIPVDGAAVEDTDAPAVGADADDAAKGPMSLRAAARLVRKDVRTVHGDVHAWLRGGVLKKNARGGVGLFVEELKTAFGTVIACSEKPIFGY